MSKIKLKDDTKLIHLIYCSASVKPMGYSELGHILQRARENNLKNNITGILLYSEGSFLQVLEGSSNSVEQIFQSICSDRRHDNITMIIREPIASRTFADWTMGYADLSLHQLEELIGINDFFSSGNSFANISPGRAKKIISAFRDGHWRSHITGQKRKTPEAAHSKRAASISNKFYTFAFQPIIHAPTNTIFSYEALLRGPLDQPALFVLNNVPDCDIVGFHEQCRIDAIKMASRLGLNAKLNLNFPPSNLIKSPTAIISILLAAEKCNLNPSDIILEILESEIIKDYESFKSNLQDYRHSGMTFALDDFGAGYAGLNLLSEYQPDYVKLDMNLIKNIEKSGPRQAIIRGIRMTCKELGIDLIAEGVETIDEYLWLREQGIEYFQGYLLAVPLLEKLDSEFYVPE